MSGPLIILVTAIYVGVVIDELARGNVPMALVFAGYSLANVGLLLVSR